MGLLAFDFAYLTVRQPPMVWPSSHEPISAEALGWLVGGLAFPALLLTPTPRGRIPVWGEWAAAAVTALGFSLLLVTLPWNPDWAWGHGDLAGMRLLWVALAAAYPTVLFLHDAGNLLASRARWVRAVLWATVIMAPWVYLEAAGALGMVWQEPGKPYDPMTWRGAMDAGRFVLLVLALRYVARPIEKRQALVPADATEPQEAPEASSRL